MTGGGGDGVNFHDVFLAATSDDDSCNRLAAVIDGPKNMEVGGSGCKMKPTGRG